MFTSDRRGTSGVWAIAVAEGTPLSDAILIKENLGQIYPLGITEEGKIYYSISILNKDAYTAKLDLMSGKVLTAPQKVNDLFQGRTSTAFWSPDGKFLAYLLKKSTMNRPFNYDTLRILSLESGEERDLSLDFDAIIFGRTPSWTTDGKYIFLIGVAEKQRGGFYKLDIQTGKSELIFDKAIVDWSSDGNIIYDYEYNRNEKVSQSYSSLVRINLQTGKKETIFQSKEIMFGNIRLSPDGEWIGLPIQRTESQHSKKISYIIPAQGGEPIELFQSTETDLSIRSVYWDFSGKGLLFPKRYTGEAEQRKDELWYIPSFNGSPPKKLELEMNSIWGVCFSPDGQTIAFDSSGYSESEIWVMENFLPKLENKK